MSKPDASTILGIPYDTIDGGKATLGEQDARVIMVVNVASKCGLTPQYTQLEELQKTYGERGFAIVGFPCNQFMGQEPGSAEEIKAFCSTTYGVTFPLAGKVRVNGPWHHPLYTELRKAKDADGHAGLVQWNFEKFLITPDGEVHRFRPKTLPDDPAIVSLIESNLG